MSGIVLCTSNFNMHFAPHIPASAAPLTLFTTSTRGSMVWAERGEHVEALWMSWQKFIISGVSKPTCFSIHTWILSTPAHTEPGKRYGTALRKHMLDVYTGRRKGASIKVRHKKIELWADMTSILGSARRWNIALRSSLIGNFRVLQCSFFIFEWILYFPAFDVNIRRVGVILD